MRKSYSGSFKAKVAIDVIKEHETVTELASKYQVHRALLTRWKKEAIEGLPEVFSQNNKNNKDHEKLIEELYKQIGQLTVENEWLKKKVDSINS